MLNSVLHLHKWVKKLFKGPHPWPPFFQIGANVKRQHKVLFDSKTGFKPNSPGILLAYTCAQVGLEFDYGSTGHTVVTITCSEKGWVEIPSFKATKMSNFGT